MRWAVRVVVPLLLIAAFVLAINAVSAAWGRYRRQRDYQAGFAALAHYAIPAGTVVFDPSAGPATTQQSYTAGNGNGWYLKLTKPNDPTVEKNLRLMGRFDWFGYFPFAAERQTPRGTAFVFAKILADLPQSSRPEMTLVIQEEYATPGHFPLYDFGIRGWLSSVNFLPSPGHTLPVVLAGRPDPTASSWTLPLTVDGRNEWIRVDHSGTYPNVTTSFGSIHPTNRPFELRY